MESIVNAWLSVWLYVMAAIGIVLGIRIWKNRRVWDRLNILCGLVIIVLICHVLEEWVLPGGLHYSYNVAHGSTLLDRYPMNRLTDMITNFGAVVIGCIVLGTWGYRRPSALAVMLFCAFEVAVHIIIGIRDMQLFRAYGMNVLYSPGLVTSLFGFLPVGVGLGICLFKDDDRRPRLLHWCMAIAATVVLSFLLINLPEAALGKEDSRYGFTDRGYYERFGELYEQDSGAEYFEPGKNG